MGPQFPAFPQLSVPWKSLRVNTLSYGCPAWWAGWGKGNSVNLAPLLSKEASEGRAAVEEHKKLCTMTP